MQPSNTPNTFSPAKATDLYELAVEVVRKEQSASIALIQRSLKIGYSMALHLMEAMVTNGVLSEDVGEDGCRQILQK